MVKKLSWQQIEEETIDELVKTGLTELEAVEMIKRWDNEDKRNKFGLKIKHQAEQ